MIETQREDARAGQRREARLAGARDTGHPVGGRQQHEDREREEDDPSRPAVPSEVQEQEHRALHHADPEEDLDHGVARHPGDEGEGVERHAGEGEHHPADEPPGPERPAPIGRRDEERHEERHEGQGRPGVQRDGAAAVEERQGDPILDAREEREYRRQEADHRVGEDHPADPPVHEGDVASRPLFHAPGR
ncbi:MAG: hypothetical protein R3F20_10060 [Planctomycetota bacterium]